MWYLFVHDWNIGEADASAEHSRDVDHCLHSKAYFYVFGELEETRIAQLLLNGQWVNNELFDGVVLRLPPILAAFVFVLFLNPLIVMLKG